MKNVLLIIAVFVSSIGYSTDWISSFQEGKKIALATNKLVVLDFTASWCGPCKKMERDVWPSANIQQLMANFVAVKVDTDRNRDLATTYEINAIPAILLVDSNGIVIVRLEGPQSAKDLVNELENYARSLESIGPELTSYYANSSFDSAVNLACAYYEYSTLANPRIKKPWVNLGSVYLAKAKAQLNKKDKNFATNEQKIKILEMYELAYLGNYQKLLKKIGDYNAEQILPDNQGNYYFLKYVASKALKSDDSGKIEEQLKADPKFELHIKKGDSLLATRT